MPVSVTAMTTPRPSASELVRPDQPFVDQAVDAPTHG